MSRLAEDNLLKIFEGSVRRGRGGGDKNLFSKARRVINRVPEVMVKVTGNCKGSEHMKAHMDYISRNGKVEIETEIGETIDGRDGINSVHRQWNRIKGFRNDNTRDTTNIVLSMPKGTKSSTVKDAVRAFAKHKFGHNYQYLFALHEDTDSPHVHLCVKNLGFDFKRLVVKKGDPQIWREGFAEQLRQRGVEAEATSRRSRGVVLKAANDVILYMKKRGIKPYIERSNMMEYDMQIQNTIDGKPQQDRPWEENIEQTQSTIRQLWMDVAAQLESSKIEEHQALAHDIPKFVESMPEPLTERHLQILDTIETDPELQRYISENYSYKSDQLNVDTRHMQDDKPNISSRYFEEEDEDEDEW